MDHEDLKNHIDTRFDRVETKLDDHIERISGAETSIEWIKGHLKISVTMLLAVVGYLLARFFDIQIKP